ncbi:hypothetical protein PG988_011759 [Apiospora saccharicola]
MSGTEYPLSTLAHYPAIRTFIAPRANPSHTKFAEFTSTVDAQVPDITKLPEIPELLDMALNVSLANCISHHRAQKCEGLDQSTFLERAHKFLGYWETEDWEQDIDNQTEYDLLIRLVKYQDVHRELAEATAAQSEQHCTFADNTIELIRRAQARASEAGALKGANSHILDALDVIYNDICADTKKSKVPPEVQEMTDIVLRGLSIKAERTAFNTNPEPCICLGHFPCGLRAQQWWHAETGEWQCRCTTNLC